MVIGYITLHDTLFLFCSINIGKNVVTEVTEPLAWVSGQKIRYFALPPEETI